MSVIQFYKIYLTVGKLENNTEFLQAWGLWKVKTSFTKRTQETFTMLHLPGTHAHCHFPEQILEL